ncbi:MAG: hypothetical protein JXP73_07685 [Deltaproteobacteria bacterium]|nr:hypothetical protein [Deltaproteobacteria bacterium]
MRASRVLLVSMSLVFVIGCGRGGGGAGSTAPKAGAPRGSITARIKAAGGPDQSAIFGMETPSAWSTTTAGAVLGQSSVHSQGSYSLSLRPSNGNGFTPIKSVPLTTLAAVSPTLAVDVMLPAYQPNPWWYGTAQAYIDCPSRGIWSQFLNQVELTGKPLGVWNTVNFTLTNSHIAGLLQAGYSDLTITVVVNVQVPTTGIYLVDNLRFVPVAANGCGGRPNGTSCTDNSACTLGDTCQFGTCRSGTAVTCTASDQCHDAGVCNPATGVCSNPSKPNGTSCNDGNACTQTDTCQGGACTGGNPVACVASDQCHDVGVCDPATGTCSNPAKADGTVCDDGDACTQTDACQGGTCTGGNPVACAAQDQCHDVGVCDPATGTCSNPAKPDGTSCDDNDPCTKNDHCQAGVCGGIADPVVPPATNVVIDLVASLDASTGESIDGQQTFSTPTAFTLPVAIPVTAGLAGMGTTILTFHSATSCVDVSCTYRGASTVPQATTPLDKLLGHMYRLQSCSDGTTADAALSVTSLGLHVASGDLGTPQVQVQILVAPAGETGPPSPDGGAPAGTPVPVPPTDYRPGLGSHVPPDYSKSKCNPLIDRRFTPQADPNLVPLDPFAN